MNSPHDTPESERPDDRFDNTRWSVVLAAGRPAEPHGEQALAAICRDYWYPLYVYVRRRTADAHQAHDLTQEFFARLLEKNGLAAASPQRGRFRAFLLTSLRNFLTDEWTKANALKRGGTQTIHSLDFDEAESRYRREPADHLTPERLFDRRWAETLLDRVTLRLRDEYVRMGKLPHFEQLQPFLSGRNAGTAYAEAARRLGLSEGAAVVAAHRMRRRFRDLLLAEISQTLDDPADLDDEIHRLFDALDGSA